MIDADLAACRRTLRGGSRSFFAASLLLPVRVRAPASALYAFCRIADDAIDCAPNRATQIAQLAHLHARLHRAAQGHPADHPIDRALAWAIARHAIPVVHLESLLEGLQWDAEGRRFEDLDALRAYASRVAGTVGMMMAAVMGVRDPVMLARACDLGIAMQFTNIARDIGEDARAGRIYLPLAWLRRAGIDPDAWLAAPRHDAALAALVARLLQEADQLYRRAESAIALLPPDCRRAIRAASRLYAAIGDEITRADCDAVSRRAVVPTPRKLRLMLGSLHGQPTLLQRIETRALWLIDLFALLAQREALGPSAP